MTIQQQLDSKIWDSVNLNHRDPTYIIVHPQTYYELRGAIPDVEYHKSYKGIKIIESPDIKINEFIVTF